MWGVVDSVCMCVLNRKSDIEELWNGLIFSTAFPLMEMVKNYSHYLFYYIFRTILQSWV